MLENKVDWFFRDILVENPSLMLEGQTCFVKLIEIASDRQIVYVHMTLLSLIYDVERDLP